jgi:hypothetical protein
VTLVLAAVVAVSGVSLLAQRGQQGAGQMQMPPVTVSFRALSGDGTPVGDITAEELTLKIDGRAPPLESLRLVEFSESAGLPIPNAPGRRFSRARTKA